MGKIYDCAHYKKKYGVDHVHFVEDVTDFVFKYYCPIYIYCVIVLVDGKCLGNSQSASHPYFGTIIISS